jgi:hypothetical protein
LLKINLLHQQLFRVQERHNQWTIRGCGGKRLCPSCVGRSYSDMYLNHVNTDVTTHYEVKSIDIGSGIFGLIQHCPVVIHRGHSCNGTVSVSSQNSLGTAWHIKHTGIIEGPWVVVLQELCAKRTSDP